MNYLTKLNKLNIVNTIVKYFTIRIYQDDENRYLLKEHTVEKLQEKISYKSVQSNKNIIK